MRRLVRGCIGNAADWGRYWQVVRGAFLLYRMELIRYVHSNPVRAGVVSRASESGWSSHRAYLGLASCPSWLGTEAVFGPDEEERETIRQELAADMDEGRDEGRRPELSVEVPRKLARRVRKLMGGEVELSHPVLGPDEFTVSSLKEQVARHTETRVAVYQVN